MYEYIKGKYVGINKDYIIVENSGIGYKIFTSGATMSSLPKSGEEVMLYLEQIVREDFLGLYGFDSKDELEMFKLLLTVSGVGPKAALSLLSISRVNNLKYAIMTGDEKHICRGIGIGKKTAARIILELKDKLKPDELLDSVESIDIQGNENIMIISEALSALLALGYSEKEADTALKKVNKEDSVENIIKSALKVLVS
ncbi:MULTISPECIES: Holliday junction branch migration protein RuvA [Clostridium]|jgi:Holliday junction DNA helicase RuvA|uniref:Holliday junction branch migration complex subunit RuvA n=1 Tax=Clostridium saccharoperbutylacetonicum N1-4(HMT) TaxID=931276 RepID=M1MNM5_9CLOT|nr:MULTISPECIES: Holliday junction branch migration protein RuvA [Clostridium]AGF56321.1 holliday junction ATP-dependent DNA helicase RuvA [Clostridium saccharoperbutylacetonicum N1-4(HMT)]AQR95061.1 holliday junction ATP-dependent DNA helicase RuvA [Clostridium saccharoperbutylacetonicum]NRT62935.1 Holliday junction DNA helicase RuvA [Clostridium saccharoperbutylacetonicum]NSB26292.1 Holliday junction DNA helicase RuvA [Clostridium saccharoperbutylacetonicum]NSB30908.1 Holliday junction DNA h